VPYNILLQAAKEELSNVLAKVPDLTSVIVRNLIMRPILWLRSVYKCRGDSPADGITPSLTITIDIVNGAVFANVDNAPGILGTSSFSAPTPLGRQDRQSAGPRIGRAIAGGCTRRGGRLAWRIFARGQLGVRVHAHAQHPGQVLRRCADRRFT